MPPCHPLPSNPPVPPTYPPPPPLPPHPSRWTKREKVDIFAMDMLIVSIHCNRNHWTLALVNFDLEQIEYFDSLGRSPGRVLATLRRYLNDEHMDKKKKVPFAIDHWPDIVHQTTVETVRDSTQIPRQCNDYDCGVFVCTNADYLSQGVLLDYTKKDIVCMRRRLAAQILRAKLFEPYYE